MRLVKGGYILSATDLVSFLGCRHAIYLDRQNMDKPYEVLKDDAFAVLLQEKGIQHEQEYLAALRAEGRQVVEIAADQSRHQRVALTRQAMKGRAEVIYQGALEHSNWLGYADFLIRVPIASGLGDFSYEPVDTKLSRTATSKHVLQLSVYAFLLADEQGIPPGQLHIVLGDRRIVTLRTMDFQYYFEIARQRFEGYLQEPLGHSVAVPCGHCPICRWQDHCNVAWEQSDHLSVVANITRSQVMKLESAGVSTMKALSEVGVGIRIPNLQQDTLTRLRGQARLQVDKRTNGLNGYELLATTLDKGFARLPPPNEGDLFFDMEGDPLFDGGLEYLFGFIQIKAGRPCFTPFWGHTRQEEKSAFEQAVDFIMTQLAQYPEAYVYHYASYEASALKRLAMLHGTREVEIDQLLRRGKLVDLYKVVREAMQVSEPSYSIKNLETFYTTGRQGDVKNASDSVVVYEQWRKVGGSQLLHDIADYNEADCRSTWQLRDWLISLRPTDAPWFGGEVSKDDVDVERMEQSRQAEARATNTQAQLLKAAKPEEHSYRELVAQLLEFHRREAKPEWWAMFHRQELSEEELIEDADCLGGLRRDEHSPPYKVKKSTVHTFRFPPQDFKLRVGDTPKRAATLEAAGEIVTLDEHNLTVGLKIGPKATPFDDAFSLIPAGPLDARPLRDAIYRFAEAVIRGESRYAAISSILKREHPRVQGGQPGNPILSEGNNDVVHQAARAIARLEDSYMLVQGPPGAGKTYLSAHTIVDLLSAGRRVGVASNSHKAINNLLAEIERVADARSIRFRGVKKCSTDEQRHGGKLIVDVFDNQAIIEEQYDLIAGTVWLFARPEFDQALDYLFIDEAGQVSLANIVAMGVSARNIILVGDQMQLGQPIQGVHPGESGCSALEYLLVDKATVPPDRGIFLAVSRRMHPDVCRFISEAVYEGRLHPDPSNARRKLLLTPGADPALRPSGIRFLSVAHQDCSQKSEAEGERVQQIYASLLKQHWIDHDGTQRAMGMADILVVSPYNVQVNHLTSMLPAGARVGTVDKFQGQEAAAVILSMTTSSVDSLPRTMEFLYSRHRLNVAISRARCLAIVIASPRLLEAPCPTIEHMRLVNTLCFVKAYADASN